jgi:CubicO group peptidase (beta-lactamase class C family)
MEWLFKGSRGDTAASTFDTLGRTSPTSAFGEAFQYSNLMVAAGGYVAAHAISPGKEVGAAYDEAMQDRLFAPLGMKATTFDFGRALRSNHAEPHGEDIDGRLHRMTMTMNPKIIPARPAGGVWTSAHDLSRFVEMELALGRNLEGKRLVSERNRLTRREPQVLVAEDVSYGMGLIIDKSLGIEWIEHNGSMDGYKSIMMWLPDYGIGATLLTNAESGSRLEGPFVRKLLELVFDGKPEADERLRLSAEVRRETARKDRATLTVPPEPAVVAQLAPRYFNEDLGPITITRSGKRLFFALTELRSEMVSRKNADGTTSIITVDPGLSGLEFVVAKVEGRPQLILRDAQHEYVFTASPPAARRKGPSA